MDIKSHIMRFRANQKKNNRSNPLGTIGLLLAAAISIGLAAGVIYAVSRYAGITENLPAPQMMEVLLNPKDGSLLEPTRIFDQSGVQELWRFENQQIGSRRYLSITDGEMLFFRDAPETLIQATLAAVDLSYLERPEGFIAAIVEEGPDPITRSLVEDFLIWEDPQDPNYELRVKLLSAQMIASYGREKILEWYLNSLYYGHQLYGAAQAAEYYFGKDLKDLNLAESALLAAVGKFPSLNPFDAPAAAKENQEEILLKLLDAELISPQAAAAAADRQLLYVDAENDSSRQRPVYVDYIVDEAAAIIPRDRLLRGGYRIISTLDLELQGALECTSEIMLKRAAGEQAAASEACEAGRLLPRYSGPLLGSGDSLEIDLVILDPLQGELRAMAGLRDSGGAPVFSQPRNPGSLITPFLYLNQFAQGFEPASPVWDIPLEEDLSVEILHPGCVLDCRYQGPVSMRAALVNDYLSPAAGLWLDQARNIYQSTLAVFGFSPGSELCPDCPVFPGSRYLDVIDLAQGFGVFGNQGYLRGKAVENSVLEIKPSAVRRIETYSGEVVSLDPVLVEKQVISDELAYLVNETLSDIDAIQDPSLRDVFRIGRPAAVKLGAVPGESAAWVIGYTPRMVAAAWAGNPAGEEQDADHRQIAALMWRAITQYISRDLPAEDWLLPANVISLDVCYPSGMLPTDYCPRVVREVFIRGNEPQGPDTLYQSLEINRETGLLASVFTPSSQIEERVYLNVPPEAADWAEEAGIETSPAFYDLDMPRDGEEGLFFTAPENFSFVKGRVTVIGSTPEEEFVSARLQYGKGLNPTAWIQIGDEITAPANFSRLGYWDTAEVEDGLYAIQLVLIKERQQVEKTSLVLSVDNTPPVIAFITDLSGGEIIYQQGKEILFQVEFENNSEIDEVDFYLNADLLSSRKVPPFLAPWTLAPGEYELKIIARDQAGNTASYLDSFQVVLE